MIAPVMGPGPGSRFASAITRRGPTQGVRRRRGRDRAPHALAFQLATVDPKLFQKPDDAGRMFLHGVAELGWLIAVPETQEVHQERASAIQWWTGGNVSERRPSGAGHSVQIDPGRVFARQVVTADIGAPFW